MYRLVVMEKSRDPYARHLEILGNYNPRAKEARAVLNTDRIQYWLGVGAQPSATVKNMLINAGILTGKKARSIHISKTRQAKIDEKNVAAKASVEPNTVAAS